MAASTYIPKNLIDCTVYPLDETDGVYVYLGLDPKRDFRCAFHISWAGRHVEMGSSVMEMIDFMADYIAYEIENPRLVSGFVIYSEEDLLFSVIRRPDRNVFLLQNEIHRQCYVLLDKDHVLALGNLKDTYTRDMMKKMHKIRPIVMSSVDWLVNYFIGKIPLEVKIKSPDEMQPWFVEVFGNRTQFYRTYTLQILDTAAKELIDRSFSKLIERQNWEESKKFTMQCPFNINIP